MSLDIVEQKDLQFPHNQWQRTRSNFSIIAAARIIINFFEKNLNDWPCSLGNINLKVSGITHCLKMIWKVLTFITLRAIRALCFTLYEIFICVQKFIFDFPRKLSIFMGEKLAKMLWFWTFYLLTTLISREKLSKKFGWKTRENVGDLHFLVVDNFDFPRKL